MKDKNKKGVSFPDLFKKRLSLLTGRTLSGLLGRKRTETSSLSPNKGKPSVLVSFLRKVFFVQPEISLFVRQISSEEDAKYVLDRIVQCYKEGYRVRVIRLLPRKKLSDRC